MKIKFSKPFNKNRIIIYTKQLDNDCAITILKNHFNHNQLNAIMIDDEFFNTVEKTFTDIFTNNCKFKILRCFKQVKDIEDEIVLKELIEKEHRRNNHRGIDEVTKELKEIIYYPNLKTNVAKFINNCEICTLEKYDRNPPKVPYKITETPSKPNEIVHIDVFYSLEKQLFLTFIDTYSKFAQAYRINGRTWTEFKLKLLQYISTQGKMKKIVTDN